MFPKQQSAKRFQKRVLELGFEILLVFIAFFGKIIFKNKNMQRMKIKNGY
jgi:hypothetical protein